MKCPGCAAAIDDDSRFCDHCGRELFRCPQCGSVGSGPVCVRDGTKLGRFAGPADDAGSPEDGSALSLTNATLKLRLALRAGDIIGRSEGRFRQDFTAHRLISSRHAEVQQDGRGNWTLTDLHSTNGTFLDGERLTPGIATRIRPGSLIRVANIEFIAEIA